jgi:hypothetical protein
MCSAAAAQAKEVKELLLKPFNLTYACFDGDLGTNVVTAHGDTHAEC